MNGAFIMQEEKSQKRRILDLANRCYQSGVYTYSGFLSLGDQSLVYEMADEIGFVPWMLFGGAEDCERCVLRFGSEEFLGYPEDFPVSCLAVRPAAPKFADQLSHRDFLGALMNLGIERDVLGDIIVKEDVGYVFCEDAMAEFLREHLDKVKHTVVICEITKECPAAARPEFQEEELVVSADRCDAIIAKVYRLSRSRSVQLFASKKVFVGGRQYENNSGTLKAGDVVSVRGFGKFAYDGILGETKKGRMRVKIRRYV